MVIVALLRTKTKPSMEDVIVSNNSQNNNSKLSDHQPSKTWQNVLLYSLQIIRHYTTDFRNDVIYNAKNRIGLIISY